LTRETEADANTGSFNVVTMLTDLFKLRNVGLILLSGLLSFCIMHGYFAWLPKILENSGMSPAGAGVVSALPFLTSIPAVLIFPRLVTPQYRGWLIGLMEAPEVPSKYLGSATGVFFCVAEVGGFLGPFVVGYLVDIFGTFVSGGLFLSGLGIAILWLMYLFQSQSN
jgi:cyanate permease